jgi:hypothetical protein
MKHWNVIALLTLLAASYVDGGEQGKHLFILSGQSNMAGLDPAISFTPTVEAKFGKDNVIVVKDAQDGQPILRWYKKWKPAQGNAPKVTGDLYDRLMTKVKEAIKDKQIATVTFIWMQGESDAKQHGDVYAVSLKGLLDQLRTDLGQNNLHFVIGRISDFRNDTGFPQWEMVRKAEVEVAEADPHGAWVNTDDLNDGDNRTGKVIKNNLHYSFNGYKLLGQRFADKAILLIKKKPNRTLQRTVSPRNSATSAESNIVQK